jgi:hypothetical protein
MAKRIVYTRTLKMRIPTKRLLVLLAVLILSRQEAKAQADVMIAVDLSGTMKTNDPNGYRFVGADQFLSLFSLYGSNRGGAVAFGDDARVIMSLEYVSFDRAGKYQNMFAGLGAEDWTELGKALDLCRRTLGSSDRTRSIILISEGSSGRDDRGRSVRDYENE